MKKEIIITVFTFFYITYSYGQNNSYFGSAIIPKDVYLIRVAGTNSYLSINNSNHLIFTEDKNSQGAEKLMFIPAGNGFYYIKLQSTGQYISIVGENMNNGSLLRAEDPERNDLQKFKVIEQNAGQFKLVTVNNFVVDCDYKNTAQIIIVKETGAKNQIFEILEVKTMKILSKD